MSRRKALTMIKVGLSVCLAMNFRKTQNSTRFVAFGDTENSVGLWVRSVRVQMHTECEAYTAAPRHRPTVQNLPRPQAFQARRSPSISSTKCISRFRVCEIISPRSLASPSHARRHITPKAYHVASQHITFACKANISRLATRGTLYLMPYFSRI